MQRLRRSSDTRRVPSGLLSVPLCAKVTCRASATLAILKSCAILGPFDILVDIGVPAEKEVIQ
jgi:hypothetical protein